MVYNREEAAKRAEASKTNSPGMCQAWTRTMFGAPAVGDVDRDGDADAVDGWKSEPASKRHTDRNPPRGVPVAWSGGANGFGHRAISLGNGKIRSTDAGGRGKVATVDLDWVEKNWGLKYLGWSETISGQQIPLGPKAPEPTKTITQIAKEVIAGKWGGGDDRVKRLKAAGYDPTKVQAKVNELLKTPVPPTSPPSSKNLRVDGVDISHHQQQVIDYAAAKKAGVKWMYHKATEGATFKDANYKKRRKEAAAAGLPFGAYHFARPDVNGKDAKVEAQFFINTAKPKPGDLRPALDLETRENLSGAALVKWADEFCAEVERLTGVYPVVYTPYPLSKTLESKAVMWRPRYNNSNTPPTLPYDIWQFSNGVLGKPNSVAGFGKVDLNTSSVPLSRLLIPKKEEPNPVKAKATLKFAHASLQFSDTAKQHTEDITAIFSRGYDVITGTEAGPGAGNTRDELKRIGALKGYHVHVTARYDTWVAVKKSLVKDSLKTGAEFAIWRSSKHTPKPPGRWGDRGVVWISWNMGPTFGTLSVGAVHNLTWKGAGEAIKKKTDIEYAKVMQAWADVHGKGTLLAFIGGDFNRSDKTNDVFMGQAKFKTCWDDLKKWPNTGHGNIDAIARYKPDGRVKCVGARVLDDKKLFLNTDHFLVEAEYEITAL